MQQGMVAIWVRMARCSFWPAQCHDIAKKLGFMHAQAHWESRLSSVGGFAQKKGNPNWIEPALHCLLMCPMTV